MVRMNSWFNSAYRHHFSKARPTGRFFIGREQMKKNTGILIGSLLAVILCVGLWFAFVRNKQFNDSNIIDPGEELIISGTLEIGKDLYPGTYDLEYFDTEDAQIYLYETRDGQKKAISFTLKEPVAQNIELENGNVLDLNGQDIKFYRIK